MTTRAKSSSHSASVAPMQTPNASPLLSATALLGLNAMNAQMGMWRTFFDAARAMARAQQDAFLDLARTQYITGGAEDGQSTLTHAMETTSQAYGAMGAAWLDAQRTAYEALTAHNEVRH